MSALRAVLYLRISHDRYARLARRDDRGSVPRQDRAGRALISQMRWTLAHVLSDSISASQYTKKERPGWQKVLDMVTNRECDVVVMWESARGDRKLTTWSAFLDLCADTETLIHIIDHDTTYDVRKPRDWETLADEGVRNARESRKISTRLKSTKQHMRETGQPDGQLPFGYRSVYDQRTGVMLRWEPDEDAAHVRWMFEQYADGKSIASIMETMTRQKTARKRTFSRTMVSYLLRNARYAGLMGDGSDMRRGQWAAIVDEKTFWDVQDRLLGNAKYRSAGHAKSLCGGIPVAQKCGAAMYLSRKSKNSERTFYSCRNGCTSIRTDWLDDYVAGLVVAYWGRPGVQEELERRADRSSSQFRELRVRARILEERLAEIGREGATLPLATVRAMATAVQDELNSVSKQLVVATPASSRPLLEGGSLEVTERAWHQLTIDSMLDVQREIIRGTFRHIRVTARGPGYFRTFDPNFVDAPFATL